MRCERCGNEDKRYFYNDNGIYYCRKCVGFHRVDVGKMPKVRKVNKKVIEASFNLPYSLSYEQDMVSKQILAYLKQGKDVFVYAACGAGKTELTMPSIAYYLRQGKKVGFAISRRQVVLELASRLQEAFPMLSVVAVCEGHCDITDGDLIICTMHQLYRYYGWFDLLIMDEVDAFPYRGNKLLQQITYQACVGEKLMLSATPDDEIKSLIDSRRMEVVELFKRPHGHPLIVPKVVVAPIIAQVIMALYYTRKWNKLGIKVLLFVPTIKMGKQLYQCLHLFMKCALFTSQSENKDELVNKMNKGEYDFLICTTVLERGITIKGIYVIVLDASHQVFHEASLIQIIGRVGRKMEAPDGEGIFFCAHRSPKIKKCCEVIKMMNGDLNGND